MQSELTKMVGNMQTGHPLYTLVYPAAGAESTSVLNRAANRLIRMAYAGNKADADLFPELKNTWTVGPTVNGTNYVTRPSDCIAIQAVTSAQQSTLPNWNITREFPLVQLDRVKFGYLQKDTTVTDYPHIYSLKGRSVLLHPTPSTSYIAYLRVYGIKSETALVNASDQFFMDPDWHPLVVTLAASILAQRQSWDIGDSWLASVYDELGRAVDVSALQAEVGSACIDGGPSRDSVYGG